MAQIEPEWQIMTDAEQIVLKLCNLYSDKIGHVDPLKVGCSAITNKDGPEPPKEDAKIEGVKEPVSLYCSKKYVISFHKNIWDAHSPAQKSMMLLRLLLRISEDMDGTLIQPDLKDSKALVKALGVDYMDNPALPDYAAMKQVL